LISDFHREKRMFFYGFWGILHGVRGEFTDDVSETAVGPTDDVSETAVGPKMRPTAVSETSSSNLPRTPCKNPKSKKQLSI
jgi:hypothetical protein